jgi:hypothetical protein
MSEQEKKNHTQKYGRSRLNPSTYNLNKFSQIYGISQQQKSIKCYNCPWKQIANGRQWVQQSTNNS